MEPIKNNKPIDCLSRSYLASLSKEDLIQMIALLEGKIEAENAMKEGTTPITNVTMCEHCRFCKPLLEPYKSQSKYYGLCQVNHNMSGNQRYVKADDYCSVGKH